MKLFYPQVSDRLHTWRQEVSRRFQRDAETGKPLPEQGPEEGKGHDEATHHRGALSD